MPSNSSDASFTSIQREKPKGSWESSILQSPYQHRTPHKPFQPESVLIIRHSHCIRLNVLPFPGKIGNSYLLCKKRSLVRRIFNNESLFKEIKITSKSYGTGYKAVMSISDIDLQGQIAF